MHTPLPQWALWSDVVIRFGWAAIALVIWYAMSRRGHDGGLWALVGVVLGPFAVPAAIISARRAAKRPLIVVADGASAAEAGVDVLAVVDADDPGTWTAEAELLTTVGRVELAAVISRDTLDHAAREASLRRARTALAAVAAAIAGAPPRQVILEGRPAPAVTQHRRYLGNPVVITPPNRFGDHIRGALAERADAHTPWAAPRSG